MLDRLGRILHGEWNRVSSSRPGRAGEAPQILRPSCAMHSRASILDRSSIGPRIWSARDMDPRVHQALTLLHAGYAGPLSLRDLARAAGLSPSRFRHVFREQVGTFPARYVRALRMTCARLLLERTSLPIKDVMAQIGLNDPSRFTRDFHRVYGRTPIGWRQADGPGHPPGGSDAASLDLNEIVTLANRRQGATTDTRIAALRDGHRGELPRVHVGRGRPTSPGRHRSTEGDVR